MFSRLRNIWRLGEIEMPKPADGKPIKDKVKALITGKHPATIIDMEEKQDLFPEHNETLE